jgi:ketosteroid isomerase-like protein
MAHPNEGLLRDTYAAFAAGDVPAVLAVLDTDVSWHVPGANRVSGTFHGHEEVVQHFTTLFEISEGTFAMDVQRVFADDEGGAVFAAVTARRDGKDYSYRHAHLWTIRNGRVTSFEEFPDEGRSQDLLFE